MTHFWGGLGNPFRYIPDGYFACVYLIVPFKSRECMLILVKKIREYVERSELTSAEGRPVRREWDSSTRCLLSLDSTILPTPLFKNG